jgi:hypothetical protein
MDHGPSLPNKKKHGKGKNSGRDVFVRPGAENPI